MFIFNINMRVRRKYPREKIIFAAETFCADFQFVVVLSHPSLSLLQLSFVGVSIYKFPSAVTGKMANIIGDWITEK